MKICLYIKLMCSLIFSGDTVTWLKYFELSKSAYWAYSVEVLKLIKKNTYNVGSSLKRNSSRLEKCSCCFLQVCISKERGKTSFRIIRSCFKITKISLVRLKYIFLKNLLLSSLTLLIKKQNQKSKSKIE